MNYDDYVDDKKKKKKKKKEKKEEKTKKEEENKNEELVNPYKDYYKKVKKVDVEIDDSLDKPRVEKDEVIIESKNEIKKKGQSNTLFYTIMGIIFGLLILFVIGVIIYTNIKK